MIQSLDARQDLGYKEGKGIVLIVLIQKLKDRKAERLIGDYRLALKWLLSKSSKRFSPKGSAF
jgi:hypothetical protein